MKKAPQAKPIAETISHQLRLRGYLLYGDLRSVLETKGQSFFVF